MHCLFFDFLILLLIFTAFTNFYFIYQNLLHLPKFIAFTKIYQNLPKFTKIYQNLPKFTKIYQNLPKFTKIYQNLPKFTKIYQNLPKFTKIYQNLPKFPKFATFTNFYCIYWFLPAILYFFRTSVNLLVSKIFFMVNLLW